MKCWLLGKILGFVGRKLDGYKTVIGGVGLVLTGVLGLAGYAFPDQGLPKMDIGAALTVMASGMTALGLGGKAEKIRQAMASPTVSVEGPTATRVQGAPMGDLARRIDGLR